MKPREEGSSVLIVNVQGSEELSTWQSREQGKAPGSPIPLSVSHITVDIYIERDKNNKIGILLIQSQKETIRQISGKPKK